MKSFVFGLTIIFNSARLVHIRLLLEQSPRLFEQPRILKNSRGFLRITAIT